MHTFLFRAHRVSQSFFKPHSGIIAWNYCMERDIMAIRPPQVAQKTYRLPKKNSRKTYICSLFLASWPAIGPAQAGIREQRLAIRITQERTALWLLLTSSFPLLSALEGVPPALFTGWRKSFTACHMRFSCSNTVQVGMRSIKPAITSKSVISLYRNDLRCLLCRQPMWNFFFLVVNVKFTPHCGFANSISSCTWSWLFWCWLEWQSTQRSLP